MNKANKGKEVATSSTQANQPESLDKLREDAYKMANMPTHARETVYPYLPTYLVEIATIENKYAQLTPNEAAAHYTKGFESSPFCPKNFGYYQAILTETQSVEIEPTVRNGYEWAYAKFTIKKVLTPEEWGFDLFQSKELKGTFPRTYTYFDYIDAFSHALLYDNKQRKFSWWIQLMLPLRADNLSKLPNWFSTWFLKWGLPPIAMPNKVRTVFEEFKKKNSQVNLASLYFARHYQIPWIAKWEFLITGKKDVIQHEESIQFLPILARRILVKWWDKFDFFSEKGIYHTHHVYQVITPKVSYAASTAEASLKRLLAAVGKEEFMAKIASMLNDNDQKEDSAESNNQSAADSDDTMPDSQTQ